VTSQRAAGRQRAEPARGEKPGQAGREESGKGAQSADEIQMAHRKKKKRGFSWIGYDLRGNGLRLGSRKCQKKGGLTGEGTADVGSLTFGLKRCQNRVPALSQQGGGPRNGHCSGRGEKERRSRKERRTETPEER